MAVLQPVWELRGQGVPSRGCLSLLRSAGWRSLMLLRKAACGQSAANGEGCVPGSWDAEEEEEEKQPLPQNMVQITPYITWPLSRA